MDIFALLLYNCTKRRINMIYNDFLGNKVSRLGMGNMRLPTKGSDAWGAIDWDVAQKIIDKAYSSGINYFDTAYVYHSGDSELFLGNALKKYKRDSFFVATKFLVTADPDYKKVFATQLNKLQTTYIDYYLIHSVQDSNAPLYLKDGSIDYFLGEKAAGKIKHLGFSFHGTPDLLRSFLAHHKWDFVQIQFNYLDYQFGDAKAIYEILAKENIPVIVMEPIRGGALSKLNDMLCKKLADKNPAWTPSSWALRFVKSFPQVKIILSGMHSVEQVEQNVETFSANEPLSPENLEFLTQIAKDYKATMTVPCTSCHYCCNTCPQSINIPHLLYLYNEHEYLLDFMKARTVNEMKAQPEGSRASDCLACGECTKHCPQSIDIPSFMKKIAAL